MRKKWWKKGPGPDLRKKLSFCVILHIKFRDRIRTIFFKVFGEGYQILSFLRFGGSDLDFSKVWRIRSSIFRGLKSQILSFPRFGGSDPKFSRVWKVRSRVFLSFRRLGGSDPEVRYPVWGSDPWFSKVCKVRSSVFLGLEGQILSFPLFFLQFSQFWYLSWRPEFAHLSAFLVVFKHLCDQIPEK